MTTNSFNLFSVLLEPWRQRGLLFAKLMADLQGNFAGTRFGYLWLLIDPLLLAGVYYFVVAVIFERGGPNFYLVVLIGLWPWIWFTRSVSQSAKALTGNRGSILSTSTPLSVYVLAPLLLNGSFYFVGLAVIMLLVPDVSLVGVGKTLLLSVTLFLLSYSVGLLMAIITVQLRDLTRVLDYVLRLLFFLSPVIYESSRVLDSPRIAPLLKEIYLLNPFVHLIAEFRGALLDDDASISLPIWITAIVSIILLILSGYILHRYHNQLVEKL